MTIRELEGHSVDKPSKHIYDKLYYGNVIHAVCLGKAELIEALDDILNPKSDGDIKIKKYLYKTLKLDESRE